ncbi:MAG: VOC family protein [Chromatiales bacterium]|nr:VOC family protein [Chromatiales bacterium]
MLNTNRLAQSAAFMQQIGMRLIAQGEDYAVFELRGGTHLVLAVEDTFTPGEAPFDLMVDDLAATHAHFTALGLKPSVIEEGNIHSYFTVLEPAGNCIRFNSSHVSDLPV